MKSAVFTLQHNEHFYLPKWIKYYSMNFSPEDIYILAHNSDLIDTDCNVEYMNTNEIFNHNWLTSTVNNKQHELLKRYDYVVFTDCDEFIVPKYCSLKEFLEKADKPAYRCLGWDGIFDKVHLSHGLNKTSISSIPLTYTDGYHTATPEFPISDEIELFHIHRLDYDQAFNRVNRLAKEKWDTQAIDNNLSTHNRLVDKKEFDEWFYKFQDNTIEHENYTELLKWIL